MAMVAKINDSKVILLTADSGSRVVDRRDGHVCRFRSRRQTDK
jgi:hypothetical protein